MEETTEYMRAMASFEKYGVFASGTLGRSMRPLFREGRDVVIVQKCTVIPKKYDVVLYERAGKCVLHRVIKKDGDINLIRGDNTYVIERIHNSEIIGILMEFDRGNRHYTVDNRIYKIYSVVWNAIYPIRRSFSFMRILIFKFKKVF